MPATTFTVSDIIYKLAEQENVNVEISGIDDTCYGLVISADKSFGGFLAQHSGPFNYQTIDGDPIRIVRRAIGDDLVIDYEINQTECISRQGAPAVAFRKADPETLPGQIELQYIDPDREFSITTQYAKHRYQKQSSRGAADDLTSSTSAATNTRISSSVPVDFILSADQARTIAYDYLYRIWSQQLSVQFEHVDLSIEPGDTVQLTTDQGIFTVLVQESTITKARSNLITATVLLASSGVTVTGGTADPYVPPNEAADNANWLLTVL